MKGHVKLPFRVIRAFLRECCSGMMQCPTWYPLKSTAVVFFASCNHLMLTIEQCRSPRVAVIVDHRVVARSAFAAIHVLASPHLLLRV